MPDTLQTFPPEFTSFERIRPIRRQLYGTLKELDLAGRKCGHIPIKATFLNNVCLFVGQWLCLPSIAVQLKHLICIW